MTFAKIQNGTITNPEYASNSITSPKVAADTLDGSDIKESTLDLSRHFAATGTTGSCTGDSHVLTNCGVAFITPPRPGRLLINATGEWHTYRLDDIDGVGSGTDDVTRVRGRCRLGVDGAQIGASQIVGERQQAGVIENHPEGGTMALTALSGVVSAAAHTVEVACTEEDGDMDWGSVNLTAALVDDAAPPGKAGRSPAPAGATDVADRGKE